MENSVHIEGYRIQSRLGGTNRTAVFLAADAQGLEVVLKIWSDEDGFFDELARYYAVSDLAIAPELINHFPPSISGSSVFLQAETLEHLGLEGWPLERIGILVLQYLPDSLDALSFATLEDAVLLRMFLDLGRRLSEVHALEEFHGKLCWENLRQDRTTSKLLLLDWGHVAEQQAQLSIDKSNWTVGQEMDLRGFLDLLLAAAPYASKKLKKRLSLSHFKNSRPDLQQLLKNLEDAWADAAKTDTPRRRKRRLSWAFMCFLAVFSTSFAITSIYKSPLDERRLYLMETKSLSDQERIERLFDLRNSMNVPQNALQFVTRDISRLKKAHPKYNIRLASATQLSEPLAMLMVQRSPLIFFQNQQLSLGDWLEVGKFRGYVDAIETNGIRLMADSGMEEWIPFQDKGLLLASAVDQEFAVIWPSKHNLEALVTSMSQWVYAQNHSKEQVPVWLLSHSTITSSLRERNLFGVYKVQSMTQFFKELDKQIEVQHLPDGLQLSVPIEKALHYEFGYISLSGLSKTVLLRELTRSLNIRLELNSNYEDEIYESGVYEDITWQELLRNLNVDWKLTSNNEGYLLQVM